MTKIPLFKPSMVMTPALTGLKSGDWHKFEDSLKHIVRTRPPKEGREIIRKRLKMTNRHIRLGGLQSLLFT